MVAFTPFDAPQSRTNWSIHLSYAGNEVAPLHDLQFLVGRLGLADEDERPAPTDERAVIPGTHSG
jgi:hypothetical protein